MKVIGIIQARYNSTRLPGKVCKEINGLPLLWHIYRRMLACDQLDNIAVSIGSDNCDKIVEVCHKYGMNFCIGQEDDLIARHFKTMKYFGGDAILRWTADCLFLCPKYVNTMVLCFKESWPQYQGLSSWPERTISEGHDMEVMSASLIASLGEDSRCPRDTFSSYANRVGLMHPWPTGYDERIGWKLGEDLHLSIDTLEDFEAAESTLRLLGNDNWQYKATVEAYCHVHAGK